MPVYTFGFPFGTALSITDGNPAVTVGRATVSSLRNSPDGELAVIQIDGNLNPGNSGGPVVDAKGGLVGVAVATVRNGQGIGFAVPAAELAKLMRGRVGRVSVAPRKEADGTATVRIEAELIDPAERLASAVAHYLVLSPGTKRPDTTALDKHPGSKTVGLTVGKGTAAAEFKLPAAEGEILVQVAAGAAGQAGETAPVRAFSLVAGPSAAALAGPPPAGWKEYTPADRAFVMWVPEKPAKQADEERELVVGGQTLRLRTLVGTTAVGLAYEAQSAALPAPFAAVPKAEVYDLFRGAVAAELGGRVRDTRDVTAGPLTGFEYVIAARTATARVRVFVSGPRVYLVLVRGTAAQVAGAEAETILGAFRLPAEGATRPTPAASAPKAAGSAAAAAGPKAKTPTVVGGNGPLFGGAPFVKDVAPAGGLLVGFEVGTAPAFGREMTRSVRPIYRVGEGETLGEQRGTQLQKVVTIKAKPGYAVGAIAVMHGLGFDGISVTFMRVKGDRLDPTDRYDSEYVGSDEKKPLTRLGGDGTPVVGIVGKTNARDLTGMGLLLKGQEGFTPKPR